MPNTVVINNHETINDAVLWAVTHFGADQFDFESLFPNAKFRFIFNRQDHATLFALKWI
jgi:hypothetical protein